MKRRKHAPAKARVRRTIFRARKAVSKTARHADQLDGCELDFTTATTSDEEIGRLLEPGADRAA